MISNNIRERDDENDNQLVKRRSIEENRVFILPKEIWSHVLTWINHLDDQYAVKQLNKQFKELTSKIFKNSPIRIHDAISSLSRVIILDWNKNDKFNLFVQNDEQKKMIIKALVKGAKQESEDRWVNILKANIPIFQGIWNQVFHTFFQDSLEQNLKQTATDREKIEKCISLMLNNLSAQEKITTDPYFHPLKEVRNKIIFHIIMTHPRFNPLKINNIKKLLKSDDKIFFLEKLSNYFYFEHCSKEEKYKIVKLLIGDSEFNKFKEEICKILLLLLGEKEEQLSLAFDNHCLIKLFSNPNLKEFSTYTCCKRIINFSTFDCFITNIELLNSFLKAVSSDPHLLSLTFKKIKLISPNDSQVKWVVWETLVCLIVYLKYDFDKWNSVFEQGVNLICSFIAKPDCELDSQLIENINKLRESLMNIYASKMIKDKNSNEKIFCFIRAIENSIMAKSFNLKETQEKSNYIQFIQHLIEPPLPIDPTKLEQSKFKYLLLCSPVFLEFAQNLMYSNDMKD